MDFLSQKMIMIAKLNCFWTISVLIKNRQELPLESLNLKELF